MAYTGEQRDSNLQEPKFMSNVKIVDSGVIEGFGKWALDEDGLLVIEGTGEMPDEMWWEQGRIPWESVKERIEAVRVSDAVTSIGDNAFHCCRNMKGVSLPNSVTSIGDNAFALCDSLESIILPNGAIHIGEQAFCKGE